MSWWTFNWFFYPCFFLFQFHKISHVEHGTPLQADQIHDSTNMFSFSDIIQLIHSLSHGCIRSLRESIMWFICSLFAICLMFISHCYWLSAVMMIYVRFYFSTNPMEYALRCSQLCCDLMECARCNVLITFLGTSHYLLPSNLKVNRKRTRWEKCAQFTKLKLNNSSILLIFRVVRFECIFCR